MNNVSFVTTPGGEELAIMPRGEWEALKDSLDHTQAVAEYRAGRIPGLTPQETLEFANAPSPLAFWRKYRKQTQSALAHSVGIAQNYLSEIENGKRGGDVTLWLRLARALDLPVEALVDESD